MQGSARQRTLAVRSTFIAGAVTTLEGGPVAFVRDWLDEAANHPSWKSAQDAARQLALF